MSLLLQTPLISRFLVCGSRQTCVQVKLEGADGKPQITLGGIEQVCTVSMRYTGLAALVRLPQMHKYKCIGGQGSETHACALFLSFYYPPSPSARLVSVLHSHTHEQAHARTRTGVSAHCS